MHAQFLAIALAALSVVGPIAASPTKTSPEPLKARALTARSAQLEKRINECSSGTYCYVGTMCCGIYCCYSTQICYGSSFLDQICVSSDWNSSIDPTPTATADAQTAISSSTSTSRSSSSNKSSKKSGFSSWSTGAKVGAILGPIAGVGLLATVITVVACMTCCKKRNKPQRVGQGGIPAPCQQPLMQQQQTTGTTQPPPPPSPQPMPLQPTTGCLAPPYQQGAPVPFTTEHYAAGHGASKLTQEYQSPQPVFDNNTGAWTEASRSGQVYEAPAGQR